MILLLTIQSGSGASWVEKYTTDTDNPVKWARDLVANFNATRTETEFTRKLIRLQIVRGSENVVEKHDWEKSCLVTICRGGTSYDTMRCKRCGVTGKRYGLGQNGVILDSKWRHPDYRRCDTARQRRDSK